MKLIRKMVNLLLKSSFFKLIVVAAIITSHFLNKSRQSFDCHRAADDLDDDTFMSKKLAMLWSTVSFDAG